jgi:fructose-1-phosphate kinase PfkB-like protein
MGQEGLIAAEADHYWSVRPPSIEVVNPIGCGDAMTAGLLVGLEKDISAERCLCWGTAAAAANVLTWDACVFNAASVDRLLPLVEVTEL